MVFLLKSPAVDVAQILGIDLDKGVEEVGQAIVLGQLLVDEQKMLELVLEQGPVGPVSPGFHALGGQGTEADTPTLENDGLDLGLAGLVDGSPLGFRQTLAVPSGDGLVILGQLCGLALEQGIEKGLGEGQIMGSRFPAMLDEGVIGVGLGEGDLIFAGQVELVDAADQGRDVLLLEGEAQGAHEGGLAGALDAIEANDEGLVGGLVAVQLELGEDEGDADGGLVIDELRGHFESIK